MATSRIRRLLSCLRSLHEALTGGLQINQELRLANLNLPHLDHVLLRSLLSCAHVTQPSKVVHPAPSNGRRMVKSHTAPLRKTRHTWTWLVAHTALTLRIQTLSSARNPMHHTFDYGDMWSFCEFPVSDSGLGQLNRPTRSDTRTRFHTAAEGSTRPSVPNASLHPVRHTHGRIAEAERYLRFVAGSPLVLKTIMFIKTYNWLCLIL